MSQIGRRGFLAVLGAAALTNPLLCMAQRSSRLPRVGVLWATVREDAADTIAPFEQGLRELGYVEGKNVTFEYRFAEGKLERFVDLAVELVRLNVDVIMAVTNPAISAAKQATSIIPIVMLLANDPVRAAYVQSLGHPGGNITGITFDVGEKIWGKRLELLKEAAPRLLRIGVIWNPAYPPNVFRWKAIEESAKNLSVTLLSAEVRNANEIEGTLTRLIQEQAEGIFVFGDPLVYVLRRQIAEFAIKNRLPNISPYRAAVEAGGLMAFGIDLRDTYRYVAVYVDKILRGSKAAELPVEQPRKFELAYNAKSARAIGVELSPSLQIRIDLVIE